MKLGPIRKAVVAALVGAAGAFVTAAADNHVTLAEVAVIVAAGVVAGGTVYGVRNIPA